MKLMTNIFDLYNNTILKVSCDIEDTTELLNRIGLQILVYKVCGIHLPYVKVRFFFLFPFLFSV